jgi:hypothetical protein
MWFLYLESLLNYRRISDNSSVRKEEFLVSLIDHTIPPESPKLSEKKQHAYCVHLSFLDIEEITSKVSY